MPIKIPEGLPAAGILEKENIFTMNELRAEKQDIRPLKIAILNLMPTKIATETQLIRLLSNTPLQIELTLLKTETHTSKNTSEDHMSAFYKNFSDVKDQKFDGFIITGAPVENLDYTEVTYWNELCTILEWAKKHVYSTLHICWAAQAGLYYRFGIPKYALPEKMFGVFDHTPVDPCHPLLRGFDASFKAPHSRHTEIREEDVLKVPKLQILAKSEEAGLYIIADQDCRCFYVMGHAEYDNDTLAGEYFRDIDRQLPIALPKNYFKHNDSTRRPENMWRSHANLLFSNWLNYFVYQRTPYDISSIEESVD
ncbi:MAG: homoserine O-succinyltransferase [Clostridia bacterium]|nr:homoserine O-succinyltransferase [Clostridia bacterium]